MVTGRRRRDVLAQKRAERDYACSISVGMAMGLTASLAQSISTLRTVPWTAENSYEFNVRLTPASGATATHLLDCADASFMCPEVVAVLPSPL